VHGCAFSDVYSSFSDKDPERLALKKTLYFQELLLQKICTYNSIMIPSYAHTQEDLALTLFCVDNALKSVAEAQINNDLRIVWKYHYSSILSNE